MFEALFILTTLDAGTRVGRYLLQDGLRLLWKPLGDTRELKANLFASGLLVAGWGSFLIQGVRDPLGGINSLWPLFGVAKQLLAAIALCLATTVILKMQLVSEKPRLRYTLVPLLPLAALLAITLTAGGQKIFNSNPRIGFLAQIEALRSKLPALKEAALAGDTVAKKALHANRVMQFNNLVDSVVAAGLIALVLAVVLLSVREWVLLAARKRLAQLREAEPVWISAFEAAHEKPLRILSFFALAFALAKELSGESAVERARLEAAKACQCQPAGEGELYIAVTTRRFKGVNRCC
jgi:carbon starvation protein